MNDTADEKPTPEQVAESRERERAWFAARPLPKHPGCRDPSLFPPETEEDLLERAARAARDSLGPRTYGLKSWEEMSAEDRADWRHFARAVRDELAMTATQSREFGALSEGAATPVPVAFCAHAVLVEAAK